MINKDTVARVYKRTFTTMKEDEDKLMELLSTETGDTPEEQLSGLYIRIQRQLDSLTLQQGRVMTLQTIVEEQDGNRKK